MSEIFMERRFEPSLSEDGLAALFDEPSGCFSLHGVHWHRSCLSTDGRKMICWFGAPDTQTVRNSFRKSGPGASIWPGTVHDSPATDAPPIDTANVVVERSWESPVTLDEIQALEDAGAWCLETHNVVFVRTYFSLDHKRMICLYRAPDAEAVRLAQRQAKMPVDSVWSFRLLSD